MDIRVPRALLHYQLSGISCKQSFAAVRFGLSEVIPHACNSDRDS